MFNVNNTYIRISGCIINVPLNQEGEVPKKRTISINLSLIGVSAAEWRLSGRVNGGSKLYNYSIESPFMFTSVEVESAGTYSINGNFSIKDSSSGNWKVAKVTFSPLTVTFSEDEYGDKSFRANGSN